MSLLAKEGTQAVMEIPTEVPRQSTISRSLIPARLQAEQTEPVLGILLIMLYR